MVRNGEIYRRKIDDKGIYMDLMKNIFKKLKTHQKSIGT